MPGLGKHGESAPRTPEFEKKYVETRRHRRRESGMDQMEQRQRQRRPRTQAQWRWRRRVHAGGRGTHQATTALSLCTIRWRQRCSVAPGLGAPGQRSRRHSYAQTSLSMNGAVPRRFHESTVGAE
eukprot:gene16810-biopygen5293